jgi:hypothetical protein
MNNFKKSKLFLDQNYILRVPIVGQAEHGLPHAFPIEQQQSCLVVSVLNFKSHR